MRSILHWACLLFVLAISAPAVGADRAADRPPNILFVIADDLGWGALGCYGQEKVKTPNLDRLASQGMRMTQAYAGSHVCQPSRCVLMTGKHSGHAAIRANDHNQMLLSDDVTIAEVLKRGGYTTGCFGKWGQGFEDTPGHPNQQGFDEFFGQLLQVHAHFYFPYWVWKNDQKVTLKGNLDGKRGQYLPDVVQGEAIKFIRANRDRPFFAYVGSIIPHVELVAPEECEALYRGKFPQQPILDPRPGYIGSQDGYATYAGMITRLDQHVGELLNVLDELGIADNTVVIFTSDNGGQNGGKDQGWTAMSDFFRNNGPFRGYKGSFYEGGLRVPFLVRWPDRIQAGSTSDLPFAFYDVLPTLADIGGVAPAETDGLSIVPTLTGQGEQKKHAALYWEHPVRGGIGRAARQGNWKLVQAAPIRKPELYDLNADESESNNVAEQHPEVVKEMTAFMDSCHTPPREYSERSVRATIRDFVQLP